MMLKTLHPTQGVRGFFRYLLIFLLILVPLTGAVVYSYYQIYSHLTKATLERRQAIAYLASNVVKQKLDNLKQLGVSFATRVRFRQLIREKNWAEAVSILKSIPEDFPDINRVLISDINGTEVADYPSGKSTVGKNFSGRDWYKGVSKNWQPYISENYFRAGEPRMNVIAAAIPIKDEDSSVMGILVLQISTDRLLPWIKPIDVGPSGFIYVFDHRGHLVAHPRYPSQKGIVDFSSVPVVQNALQGKRGIKELWNPIEKEQRLSAFTPVEGYGWGVVAQQPAKDAFVHRNRTLKIVGGIYFLLLFTGMFLASFVSYALHSFEKARNTSQKLLQDLQETMAQVKTLKGLIPICSSCKKIRDDKGFWQEVESYVAEHSDADFTHGMCQDCVKKLYPDIYKKMYHEGKTA